MEHLHIFLQNNTLWPPHNIINISNAAVYFFKCLKLASLHCNSIELFQPVKKHPNLIHHFIFYLFFKVSKDSAASPRKKPRS